MMKYIKMVAKAFVISEAVMAYWYFYGIYLDLDTANKMSGMSGREARRAALKDLGDSASNGYRKIWKLLRKDLGL